jgi:hypothetical protein
MGYGSTAHNRTVYASPPVGGSGYGFARSIASLIPTQNLLHSLPALVLLRKPLFGLSNRRKQPERYATFVFENFGKKHTYFLKNC